MPMKPFLAVAALGLALPSVAFAQVAAGSVPNPFDRPAGAPSSASQATASAPQAAAEPLSPTPANAASEEALRTIISGLQAGTPDYSLLTEGLATQLRAQAPTILPLMQGFGAIQSFDFAGSRSGADLFVINFANAQTEWIVGMDEGGKVAALLFRPAEGSPASTATRPPAPATSPQP